MEARQEDAVNHELLTQHEAVLPMALKIIEEPSTAAPRAAVSLHRAAEANHPWLGRMNPAHHAGHVVEPALLASVRPPTISYVPAMPRRVGKTGVLSELQLEAVLYAGQCHSQPLRPTGMRPGFLLADGAGVGKGRTQAAIILDAWLQGHQRAIWVSASADLYADAKRDLHAVCTSTSGLPPLHSTLINLTSVPQQAPIPTNRGGENPRHTLASARACRSACRRAREIPRPDPAGESR